LGGIDALQRSTREALQRAAQAERDAKRLEASLALARRDDEGVRAALAQAQRALAPRLVALYRLGRRDRLSLLLTASDFASLVRRDRALRTLVAADLRALEELSKLAGYQALMSSRLERLERSAEVLSRGARVEAQVAQARAAHLRELLATTQAQENRASRLIAELEAQERELSQLVGDLKSSDRDGLRARKGHLPFPAQGLVEVGFGKVVNPRFNTVTVQKGIDVRAPLGSEVVSIAQGTVVFSGWLKGYGNLVIVDHGSGYHSLYAHLANSAVEVGNVLEEGEGLGQVGDTGSLKGAFLYFEIRKKGQAIDPLPWLSPEGTQ
jgi:septal ring factor EnvC (AmiA/AmiB activator)